MIQNMSEINLIVIELYQTFEIIYKSVIDESTTDIKALKALALHEKMKQNKMKYQNLFLRRTIIRHERYYEKQKHEPKFKENVDDKQNYVIKKIIAQNYDSKRFLVYMHFYNRIIKLKI